MFYELSLFLLYLQVFYRDRPWKDYWFHFDKRIVGNLICETCSETLLTLDTEQCMEIMSLRFSSYSKCSKNEAAWSPCCLKRGIYLFVTFLQIWIIPCVFFCCHGQICQKKAIKTRSIKARNQLLFKLNDHDLIYFSF